jgi:hypothetical protein
MLCNVSDKIKPIKRVSRLHKADKNNVSLVDDDSSVRRGKNCQVKNDRM